MTKSELQIKEFLEWKGEYTVLSSGWPDFLCYRFPKKPQDIMAVEVKSGVDSLRDSQSAVHRILRKFMPVHIVRVDCRGQIQWNSMGDMKWTNTDAA